MNLENFKKYYKMVSDRVEKHLKIDVSELPKFGIMKYRHIVNLPDHFIDFIKPGKTIKVLIADDSRTLKHYWNVLEPAYKNRGISLELLIIGSVYKKCVMDREKEDSRFYDTIFRYYESIIYANTY
jgi:hypothetical protein